MSACSRSAGLFRTNDGSETEPVWTFQAENWRKRVGVEPTDDRIACHPPVLKTGTITGPHALPRAHNQWPRTRFESVAHSFISLTGLSIKHTRGPVRYFGCDVTRRYGFRVLNPGNFCAASSFETAPVMITSSPGFQFAGVATLCLAVSCMESTTRSNSSKLRPVVIG